MLYEVITGRVRRDGDLRRLLDEVEAAGELHRISAQVDPDLEIAAVTDRVCKETVVFPELSGPYISIILPRGTPPMPSAT